MDTVLVATIGYFLLAVAAIRLAVAVVAPVLQLAPVERDARRNRRVVRVP